uniref:pentatricopeptide repeat-containing protein At3g60050-like n=1 Tax=Erigeron canadensis TaxID=72917 RepID=UPI001CB98081|nr:pentatricopeptide repeat-containing protein At3g60050-like [Erigeron canadensis]XP_043618558.1 pentatricopeptide repeat-containing protein At3g60050-like [Erigeron canadensis]
MSSIAQLGHKFVQGISCYCGISRSLCSNSTTPFTNGFRRIEKYLIGYRKCSNSNLVFDKPLAEEEILDSVNTSGRYSDNDDKYDDGDCPFDNVFSRASFVRNAKLGANEALKVLQQDGPGFDTKSALDSLDFKVSGLLVREVLIGILKSMNHVNRKRCARLGHKFFVWSGEKESYNHTVNTYHLIMQILAEADELLEMWELVDEMTGKGYPVTSRTFNILICTCGEAGVAKKVVERFIKSKSFNFRPFSHSFNAILHALLAAHHYKLIEWVYQQMLTDGHQPDALTYNIIMYTKYRLGKLGQFHQLLDEMGRSGFPPDFHTFNILLHILGKGDKPSAAVDLLNHMKEVGIEPSVLHFTTLIDGLSRAGNMDACKYFFEEMINYGCEPDVVSYTVMITGHIAAGQLEKAEEMFSEMFNNGKIPNVYTYNAMIRGLCMAGKFEYACLMLKEMESRGCNPNFLVYSTLVRHLKHAGKRSEADNVIKQMVEKGHYGHLHEKLKRYRRC